MLNESKVLQFVCKRVLQSRQNDFVELVTSKDVAKEFNCTRYAALKSIHNLCIAGFLRTSCESAFNESTDKYVVCNGFTITQKVNQTEEYENALYLVTEQ